MKTLNIFAVGLWKHHQTPPRVSTHSIVDNFQRKWYYDDFGRLVAMRGPNRRLIHMAGRK